MAEKLYFNKYGKSFNLKIGDYKYLLITEGNNTLPEHIGNAHPDFFVEVKAAPKAAVKPVEVPVVEVPAAPVPEVVENKDPFEAPVAEVPAAPVQQTGRRGRRGQ